MIELNNNNPKQCDKCIHDRVCNLKDKLKAYIEEYDVLNEKYGDLFPKNPNCPEYLSNNAINRHYHEIPNDGYNEQLNNIKEEYKREKETLDYIQNSQIKEIKGAKRELNNPEERKPLDKSKIFYYDLDSMPKSNLNFVDENKKQLTEEYIIKALERAFRIR